jgi:hypothetical protein
LVAQPVECKPLNFNQYSTVATETGGPVPEVNYGTPFKIIRYADVLLMAAEAYTRDNQSGLAVPLIKLVRESAGDNDHSAIELSDQNPGY